MIAYIRQRLLKTYRGKKLLHLLLKTWFFRRNPLYRYFYLKNVKSKAAGLELKPSFVIIENTNLCNLSCIFCANEQMKRPKGLINNALFESIIEQCARYSIPSLIIQGFGEPLLDKNYIEKVRLAKQKGIENVYCVTNGILLNESLSLELIRARLDYLCISIDAASPAVYGDIHRTPGLNLPSPDFDKVVRNIDSLIRLKKEHGSKKPFIEVRFKDFDKNKKDLVGFMDKYRNRVDNVNIYMNIANWPGSSVRNNLPAGRLVKFPCYNLWSTLYVTHQGIVSLCCQDYECSITLGDLNSQDLMDIWKGQRLAQYRALHLRSEFDKISVCKECVINSHFIMPWW